MSTPYFYVRFRWWRPQDLDEVVNELNGLYEVSKKIRPRDEVELTLYGDQRDEVTLKADTLAAILGSYKAILYQKEWKPFTAKDLALRKKVFELYDKTTPTPFPWGGDSEPRYDIEMKKP